MYDQDKWRDLSFCQLRKYEESSNKDDEGASNESRNYLQGEIGSSTNFLLGARSCFGRAI